MRVGILISSAGLVLLSGCARDALPASGASGAHDGAVAGCREQELRASASHSFAGKASYYHDSLAGNPTASGEPYEPGALTAAHRELPFGTRLRLTRSDVEDSPTLCVTVNDRGPFAGKGRVVDLSRRAAEHLRMIKAGVVPVRVEVLDAR